jgi:hypothetical protein
MKMDFDFSTIVYTLAVIAYTLYSWTKKDGRKRKKMPDSGSDGQSGLPNPQPTGKDAEPQLPGWLRDLLDENSDAQRTSDRPGPMTPPAPAPPARTQQRKASNSTTVRHRDSQEVLPGSVSSLEYAGPEIKSLEDVLSSYEAVGTVPKTLSNQTASGKSSLASPDSGSDSESSEYLQFQDLRRAIIWSEILKPHPEQLSNLH